MGVCDEEKGYLRSGLDARLRRWEAGFVADEPF